MKDFWYDNPCKVIFGCGKVSDVGLNIAGLGKRVLFVHGHEHLKKSGLFSLIHSQIESAGLEIVDFGGVKSNPVLSHVEEGVALARRRNVDCVLAVGGGSVIDEAKIIAAGVVSNVDIWSFFSKNVKPQNALPIMTVLTIPATGSETNSSAVITNEKTKEKYGIGSPCLVPKISILDPELTLTIPKRYVVYGFVDAFSHVMEGYFNGELLFLELQDRMAEGVFKTIMSTSKKVLENPTDLEFRADSIWAAGLASNFLLRAGRGKVVSEIHCVAHSLGALFNIPHGAAISVVILAWMIFRKKNKQDKMAQFANRALGLDKNLGKVKLVEKGIEEIRNWQISIGAPTSLMDLGIEQHMLEKILENLKSSATSGGMRDVDDDDLRAVIGLMF